MRLLLYVSLNIAAACLFPLHLLSQETEEGHRWYDAITCNGMVSFSYAYNFNRPDTMRNMYRVFDIDDNSMKLDALQFSVARKAVNSGDAGFRADVYAGSSIPRVTKAAGMDMGDIDLVQGFATYIAPFGSGLKLDIGKFVTSAGYEVIEGYDGYNDNESHSFLFGYAIPFTHTGIKASYSFNDDVSAMVMLVNGWDNAVDNNRVKSWSSQVGVTPFNDVHVYVTYMRGPEKQNNDADIRTLVDMVGIWNIDTRLAAGINVDYGTEEHSAAHGSTAAWGGVAGYLRFRFDRSLACSIRGEIFHDWDGLRTGTAQQLQEITFTPELQPVNRLIIRSDLRYDRSDKDVFQTRTLYGRDQTTVNLNVLYMF